jgi:regulator of replication initiation timing
MKRVWLLATAAAAVMAAGCNSRASARADSLQMLANQQSSLSKQLTAQKDSLTQVVLDADQFITRIDSQISTVKGLPKGQKREGMESPIQEQLVRRKEMMARVNALVARAKATSAQLAEAKKHEAALLGENEQLKGENAQLHEQIERDQKMIADLGETIQRQTATIASLETRVDSLNTEMRSLAMVSNRAFYIVGTENELIQKGVIVKEGGANLLFVHPGRTLQPARTLNPELFTAIDAREVKEIQLPDSTKRYQVVSRQSLDDCDVKDRDKATFKGGVLHIADAGKFWGPSRYLILVQR